MTKIFEWIHSITGLDSPGINRLFASLVIVFLLWLLRAIIVRILWRKSEDSRTRYRWQKGTAYAAFTIGFLLIGRVWFVGFHSVATFLGLLGAGIAIALQDPIRSMAGWMFILWRRPFVLGDRIQIGDIAGDVIDIRLFKFTIMEIGNWVDADQTTGRIIDIPNGVVFTDKIANYNVGFEYIWNEVAVLVTFESDWQKAKAILRKIAEAHAAHLTESVEMRLKEASKRFMISIYDLAPTVYTCVKDCGVLLTIRYLIKPEHRRSSDEAIWEDVLKAFADCPDIDFAYPTVRYYDNPMEGKEGMKPPPLD
ncbi:mechanosensitive ion channel family protein [bacterium]|nr:mechanosensitive ion channel family protein [bacterium]